MVPKIVWPEGKSFAFTIFDDTDAGTIERVGPVYSLLNDCGIRTTKSCWAVAGDSTKGTFPGPTCEDPEYARWMLDLEAKGFEIGWHNSTWHGLPRKEIFAAMEKYAEVFHHYPVTMANHSRGEGIYWGDARLTGLNVPLYNLITRFRHHNTHRGHAEGNEFFWGDLCKQRIKYCRNFVFQDVNTLKCCPLMPYYDPKRPFVNYWYASSNGNRMEQFNRCLSEENQDRLEAEGGACIVYTHFACGFTDQNRPEARFASLMKRLGKKNGWFVPVNTLLDYLLQQNGHREITAAQRRRMEWKWLWEKIFVGRN